MDVTTECYPYSAGMTTIESAVFDEGWREKMEALRKMTLMPAQRLEHRVPAMKNKGRLRVGADADLVIFDPERVIDRSTYEEPGKYSAGIQHVLVNGVSVVQDGRLQSKVFPGRAVRAPLQTTKID